MDKIEPIKIKRGDNARIINLIDYINIKIACNEPSEKLIKQYNYINNLVNELRNKDKIIDEFVEYTSIDDFLDKYCECPLRASELAKTIKNKCDLKKTINDIETELKESQKYKLIKRHNISFIKHT